MTYFVRKTINNVSVNSIWKGEINIKELAPVGIITYSRLTHLRRTVESLKENTLAKKSDLYIFSDAAKPGDEVKISLVRDYISTIEGFNKITIVKRKVNSRVKNRNDGLRQLLDTYGKVIWMEDDNVTSPYFLKYINGALNYYENNKRILTICGFNPPVKYRTKYSDDFYLSRYFCAYGWGIWENRNIIEVLNRNDYYLEILQNKQLRQKIKQTHPHLPRRLKSIYLGKIDAADFKISYYMRKNDLYCIKPINSYVLNIGLDGSGLHCHKTEKFNLDLNNSKKNISFSQEPTYNNEFDKEGYIYTWGKSLIHRKLEHYYKMFF